MQLSDICEDSNANNFDFHTFVFASTYLMIDDAFIFKILQTSGDISFRSNDTILPSLYALLNLNLGSSLVFLTTTLSSSLALAHYCFMLLDAVFSILNDIVRSTRNIFIIIL